MLELHPAALREQRMAAAWYDDARPGLGDRFLAELVHAIEDVELFPEMGRPWAMERVPDGVRRVRLRRFPYRLIYVTEPRLVVIAVAHERRKPGYWLPRMQAI